MPLLPNGVEQTDALGVGVDRSLHTHGPLDRIGDTPLVRLRRLVAPDVAWVLVKDETANPTGSIHDRTALATIEAGPGTRTGGGAHLVCACTDDFGLSLAFVGAAVGHRVTLVMPESVPTAWRLQLERWGAEVELTPAEEGLTGAELVADRKCADDPRCHRIAPRHDAANPDAHRRTTALEIWRATSGRVDAFVCNVATGGTLTAVGELLKTRLTHVEVVAAELAEANGSARAQAVGRRASREGQGPADVANRRLVDRTLRIEPEEARAVADRLASEEGLNAGLLGGVNVAAALQVAGQLGAGRVVVAVVPDSGERVSAFAPGMHERSSSLWP